MPDLLKIYKKSTWCLASKYLLSFCCI